MRNITIPFQITKIDEDQRRVWGVATDETLDSQGDVIDYEASKKAITDWMKTGNIREMHDNKKAVGKAFDAQFDDAKKSITVGSYISQSADGENTWIKVKEGILTGYSVGGQVHKSVVDKVKEAADGAERTINRITDWAMSELSLVDNPANPSAQIVMVKSKDGESIDYLDMQKVQEFLTKLDETLAKSLPANSVGLPPAWWLDKYQNSDRTKEAMREYNVNQLSKMEKRDFSDKQRQDMADKGQALPDGSFPIANKTDLANAIKAYGRAKNKAKAKAHIITRAKALGATSMLPDNWSAKIETAEMTKAAELRKDFFGVATLVDVALQLQYFQQCEMDEGDESTVSAVGAALDAIKEATSSELEELDDENVVVMANTISAGKDAMDLAKKEGKVKKIIGTTANPAKPPRKNNPAADDPEAKSPGDNSDDEAEEDTDGKADAPSEQTDSDGNAPKDGEPSEPDLSDSADGAADAPTPADPKGASGPADVAAAEPAAPTGDTPTAAPDPTTGTDDGSVDAPSETDKVKGDDDEEDDEDDDSKSQIAEMKKSLNAVQDQVKELTKVSELAKVVTDLSGLVKESLAKHEELAARVEKVAKQPMPVKTQASYTEVIKGQELGIEQPESDGMTESEIVSLFKRADDLIAHPGMGTPQERGEVMRKLWGIDRTKFEHLLK